ncbi:hypothetical protein KL86DYS2_11699 [uncultured Dysgonomonas sp.]|uniref:Uncharacterized protein n=1 Tax=uncultured Dysgonomonas sp. TaxID=206096 RepID=A0A212JK01_9BACT|nr:hypothetical protein KL86DYS2_11699 [uncultured Dysgonomonas sp.]
MKKITLLYKKAKKVIVTTTNSFIALKNNKQNYLIRKKILTLYSFSESMFYNIISHLLKSF